MAVVIQELVCAQSAGVLFFDPSRSRHIIEAAWGYGETVVDGSVSPDRYEIDTSGNLDGVTLGDKNVELVKNGSGLKRREVEAARARARCLDDGTLRTLAALGQQTATAFGDARDIEWALASDGVYCLQARPITRQLR
jgi:pyruvate,water dikinase